jgi:hypothetical protein
MSVSYKASGTKLIIRRTFIPAMNIVRTGET